MKLRNRRDTINVNGETVIASRAYYKDITNALKDPAI